VRSVCRVQPFTTGWQTFRRWWRGWNGGAKWLRQQSKDVYDAGFDALVARWDKCIDVGGGYGENFFFRFEYHMFCFISICDLFTDSPLSSPMSRRCHHKDVYYSFNPLGPIPNDRGWDGYITLKTHSIMIHLSPEKASILGECLTKFQENQCAWTGTVFNWSTNFHPLWFTRPLLKDEALSFCSNSTETLKCSNGLTSHPFASGHNTPHFFRFHPHSRQFLWLCAGVSSPTDDDVNDVFKHQKCMSLAESMDII
jgi:hypothetical protein